MKARALRERATDAILVAPIFVSDRTCAALVGLEPRAFRELVQQLGVPALRHGKRILVRAKDLEALAFKIEPRGVTIDAAAEDPGDVEGEAAEPTREQILARVAGRR